MLSFGDMLAAVKDAYIVLEHAQRIEYRGGDFWAVDDEHRVHPVVPRLRAASTSSFGVDEPNEPISTDLIDRLREERRANENMRSFLVELEDVCRDKGMPDSVVGRGVLKWIGDNVTGS